ncbi:Piso0_000159 [Millerozyma farinosa CBS 7064]|uniref:Piso0_000159 protein n=1 Tax=Pichia sorbitophila (strain ATCC MYA-4447 / BCRC 22081 / CBS 7064 / NBRC 10061 / NRRL Y-12695) TaxID=559304 RepID=G8YT87_PICSO|nr:Piso0_000159 [Millerozyma farinosa CBS 7064]
MNVVLSHLRFTNGLIFRTTIRRYELTLWKNQGVLQTLNSKIWKKELHSSAVQRIINPLLPFDVSDEVENEELEEKNEELKKQKKKLVRQAKKIQKEKKTVEKSKPDNDNGSKQNDSKEKSNGEEKDESESSEGNLPVPMKSYEKSVQLSPAASSDKHGTTFNKSELPKTESSSGQQEHSKESDSLLSASEQKNVGEKAPEPQASGGGSGVGGGSGGSGGGKGNGNGEDDDSDPRNKDEGDKDNEVDKSKGKENENDVSPENQDPPEKEESKSKSSEEPEEDPLADESEEQKEPESKIKDFFSRVGKFFLKCFETIGITLSSLMILGFAGIAYHRVYNDHVLDKMDSAFEKGDPAYQLAIHKKTNKRSVEDSDIDLSQYWVKRPQQQILNDIVSGKIVGRYFLLLGEKGTGKTSLLLEAMKKVDGYNVAIFDAHTDPEIFRIRLGRALNFAYAEDYIGSLFSIRGPRDTTALLDIERALNKLEELALRRVATSTRPLVLIINNTHLIRENEEGIKLIELLQQKAESLSGSGLVTMIFNTDDYWVYQNLKKLGTRLEVINVRDLNRSETLQALQFSREKFFPRSKHPELLLDEYACNKVYDLVGGRPQHITQVARHRDVIKACHEIIDREKTWLLNQCGLLGMEMDDDVMEYGKFATSAMLLMRELVRMDRERFNTLISLDNPHPKDMLKDHHLPNLPLWRARQIMTRPDYIQRYDNLNIFTLDSDARVRADSTPMMRAFHEIASQPHFSELLEDSLQRVADIESLGRTREITLKDLGYGSQYEVRGSRPSSDAADPTYRVRLEKSPLHLEKEGTADSDDDDCDLLMGEISSKDSARWWKRRMKRFHESYLPANTATYGPHAHHTDGSSSAMSSLTSSSAKSTNVSENNFCTASDTRDVQDG